MRLIFSIIALITLIASPAMATPPQFVGATDRIIGQNETHLFLLRTIDDNYGSHFITASDVTLIAKNIKSGADDEVWPVISVVDHGVFFEQNDLKKQVMDHTPKNAVEPFSILRDRGAGNILPPSSAPMAEHIKIDEKGIILGFPEQPPSHRLTIEDARQQILGSLKASRRAIPARYKEGDEDYLLTSPIDVAKDCKVDQLFAYISAEVSDAPDYAVRLRCNDAEDLNPLAIFVTLRKI